MYSERIQELQHEILVLGEKINTDDESFEKYKLALEELRIGCLFVTNGYEYCKKMIDGFDFIVSLPAEEEIKKDK